MPLQKQVEMYLAPGVPGSKADMNVHDYHPNTLQAETDLIAGTFVWRGTDPATQAKYGGAGAPLGLIERNIVYPNYQLDDGSMVIPAGFGVQIVTRGAMWATTTTAATVGQSVIAATADGTISTGAAGDAGDTGWIVETAGEVGDVIIIKRS